MLPNEETLTSNPAEDEPKTSEPSETNDEPRDLIPEIERCLTKLAINLQGLRPESRVGQNLINEVRQKCADGQYLDARMEEALKRVEESLRQHYHPYPIEEEDAGEEPKDSNQREEIVPEEELIDP
jgi:hypothetical protein